MIIGIRGGLTQASKRYAKANNLKTADYDRNKPNSWIIYQDCKYNTNIILSILFYIMF